ncbi:MAG TPA: acyltransferase, partial [Gaiellaceae bacterium]|nr:acyltransferase [Gaiellaceae bacterium]
AAQPGTNPLGRLFSIRPLVGLGLISYGVYLWHWPIVVWLTPERTHLDDGVALFALRAAVTLVVSLASYFLVEQPIRQGRMLTKWTSAPTFAALGVVSAMVIVLVAPVVFFPSVNPAPRVAPSETSVASTAAYASGARCDDTVKSLSKLPAGTAPKIELFGNSVGVEVTECLGKIVHARGGTLETVTHSGRAPCLLMDDLRSQVADPATRPDIAIFSAAIIHTEPDCTKGDNFWLDQVNEALDIWRQAGVKVYLVPVVANVAGTEPKPPDDVNWSVPTQHPEFDQLSAADPTNVGIIDAGIFLRDAAGVYQWRMPCLPGGEPGCDDSDHTIGVRWVDGFHFCTDPHWNGHSCVPEDAGGERRAAAAIARQIPELQLASTRTATP